MSDALGRGKIGQRSIGEKVNIDQIKKLFQTKKDTDTHNGKRSEHTKNGGTARSIPICDRKCDT